MDNGACSYRRFLEGDDTGLAQIVDTYYDGLVFYINSYVCDLDLAEDIAEETLIKLVTKKPRFKENSSFKTWLYSIGRNHALDAIRRHSRLRRTPLEDCRDLPSDQETESAYFREDRKRMIYRAMVSLKPEYRQILWLYYFEELSQKECAQVMKKSLDSVKHLANRARLALKSELEKEEFSL